MNRKEMYEKNFLDLRIKVMILDRIIRMLADSDGQKEVKISMETLNTNMQLPPNYWIPCLFKNKNRNYFVNAKAELEKAGYSVVEEKDSSEFNTTYHQKGYALVWKISKKIP